MSWQLVWAGALVLVAMIIALTVVVLGGQSPDKLITFFGLIVMQLVSNFAMFHRQHRSTETIKKSIEDSNGNGTSE